ncbi:MULTISPECIES: type VI secretion system contractile sheath small subunit [Zooshikella]|uniref:Type VI secretion system contractile sheath small subunit n=1 Tax=Zooshikella ganghwensis TaxID=202772 RepID=A0A4V1IN82_9GAMM|nr:type VI secretion system contractile sheath small subunit [Zooshikella ganghwensis]RDH42821.1 type VI secretion system contractile sheath small subunit [Zooshikella ganghwensis]
MAVQDMIPKSRMTLRYRTEVKGEVEDVELPLRILVLGDFSGKHTEKVPFAERSIVRFDGKNLNAVMEKMKIKTKVEDGDGKTHTIPIENVDSFLPYSVCREIKNMNDLVTFKKMLNTLLSSINNSGKFRQAIKSLIENPEAIEALKKLMAPSYEEDSKFLPALMSPDAE